MKKIYYFLLLVASVTTQAQEFKKFKFGIGLAPVISTTGDLGLQLYLEPMLRITDKLAVSFELDGQVRYHSVKASATNQPVPWISSRLNAQYYFTTGTFRPFAGLGLGLFKSFEGIDDDGIKFGFCPRVGFDLSYFNFSIDYNYVAPQESVNYSSLKPTKISNSYIAIRFGISIGGGKIK